LIDTFTLLKAALDTWRTSATLGSARFLHVSTDEVDGSLGFADPAFTESSPYRPNSPARRARRRATISFARLSRHSACRR
jgi:dTDP-glucose 4,6-dehydratase